MIKDSELLNLIEHYRWKIEWTPDDVWNVSSEQAQFQAIGATLRLALDKALDAQRLWSLS